MTTRVCLTQEYQQATCEQLWEQSGEPKSAQEETF
jgi:hypothetical protein